MSTRRAAHGRSRRRRQGAPRWLKLGFGALGLLLLVVIVSGVFCALDARTAYAELRDAQQRVSALREQALTGDRERVEQLATELREHTGAARESLTGPHWTIMGWVPWVGPNVRAVQTVSFATDDLATGALEDLVDAVSVVDPSNLAIQDGRINIEPIAEVAPQVVSANDTVQEAVDALAEIDTDELLLPVSLAVGEVRGQVNEIGALTGTASRAVQLIPPMMGIDGPRDYLVLVQNNAEPRATGGIPGAIIHLRTDDGALEIVEQQQAGLFGPYSEPVLELDTGELSLYGEHLGRYMQNVTFTPHFPRTAQLTTEMWQRDMGEEIDGVASIDPVALGALLRPTGSVELPSGQSLTPRNTPQLLMNQIYLDIESPQAQDQFFEAAAAAIFEQVIGGAGNAAGVVPVLDEVSSQGRLMLWSAHEQEQSLISGTNLAGELRGHVGDRPVVGIFVHDLTAAKIGYYEHVSADIRQVECRPDGSRELEVAVTISNEVPADFENLPPYLVGDGRLVDVGDIRTRLFAYAPTGGRITDFQSSDGSTGVSPSMHDDLYAAAARVVLSPGQSQTFTFTMDVPADLSGEPLPRITPGPAVGQFSTQTSPCGG
ncbi:DUF4012 domain-containing protein [Georgenia alba]|uniref:DUF4012 domain-containing protein n=1 Tax=Georgenia alba TaxID=2233858 RepID=A0ABW2Q6R8_9MICO